MSELKPKANAKSNFLPSLSAFLQNFNQVSFLSCADSTTALYMITLQGALVNSLRENLLISTPNIYSLFFFFHLISLREVAFMLDQVHIM